MTQDMTDPKTTPLEAGRRALQSGDLLAADCQAHCEAKNSTKENTP
jgi:hypothetical protein